MQTKEQTMTHSDDIVVPTNPGQAVDVTQLAAVEQWTRQLGVSEEALRLAVAEVGTSAEEVRTHLGVS
jgi:hypothetical protein